MRVAQPQEPATKKDTAIATLARADTAQAALMVIVQPHQKYAVAEQPQELVTLV